jgi:F-type H+-transporting ATPase subunit alpha
LLALTAKLFDPVAFERVTEAEAAVRTAAASIPADVRSRLETASSLSAADHKTILDVVQQALKPFQPNPPPKPDEANAPTKGKPVPTLLSGKS